MCGTVREKTSESIARKAGAVGQPSIDQCFLETTTLNPCEQATQGQSGGCVGGNAMLAIVVVFVTGISVGSTASDLITFWRDSSSAIPHFN